MTVTELIAKLQTMPPEAVVLYRACSEWNVLDEEEVELVTPESEFGIIKHHDLYMTHRPKWDPPQAESVRVTVVTLPGN